MGLSMGGTLAIRLAEQRPDDVDGLVLVNPSLLTKRPDRHAAAACCSCSSRRSSRSAATSRSPASPSWPTTGCPVKAAYSLSKLWLITRTDLGKVTQPILIFRSREDHVVEPDSCVMLKDKVSSSDVREVVLEDSYHVATLDNDAETIFAGSLEFVQARSHVP